MNVKTDPQNQENAQHDLIEFLYSLKEDIMMDIRNVSYINILENMLIYAENPSVTLPCKIFEDMSLSEIFTVFNSNGINIPPHSLCESVLNRSNEEEEIVSRPSSPLETDGTQKEPSNVQKIDETSPNESSYLCDQCESSFSEKANLLIHKKTKHNIYQCELCDECFSQTSYLKKHLNSHSLQCIHCGKSFKRKYHLDRHINSVHKQITYQCDECQSSFTQEAHLQRHIQIGRASCRERE